MRGASAQISYHDIDRPRIHTQSKCHDSGILIATAATDGNLTDLGLPAVIDLHPRTDPETVAGAIPHSDLEPMPVCACIYEDSHTVGTCDGKIDISIMIDIGRRHPPRIVNTCAT